MKSDILAKISNQVGIYSPEEIAIIKETVAKGFTDIELAYFLNVAKAYQLSPFLKQIWGYKDNKNNLIIFAGRDGFLAKAQRDSRWNGLSSDIVREGEFFSMNVAQGKIEHHKDVTSKAPIIGAYAISKPKGTEFVTIEWADFATYNKGYNVWRSDPAAMIKKVAESHCLSKAYGITGLASEYDFDTSSGTAITIDHEAKPTLNQIAYADELVRNCTGDENYKLAVENRLNDPELTNMELEDIISDLQLNQPKKY